MEVALLIIYADLMLLRTDIIVVRVFLEVCYLIIILIVTFSDLCPVGKALYRDPSSKSAVRCTISSNSQCPTSYTCQSDIPGAFQGHCCSASYLCPNKAEFFIEENTQMPRSCTVGAFITCPNGYTCQSTQSEFTTGHCCKGDIISVSGID